ncbi:Neuropeptide-like 1 [Eumeta japonica]|uniref:Neuropeptide-like 1 n=1 Tax=Eumeta variegata TaxID=151549 RepID=A0A4C1V1E5_EUMVA|nr:Neuropeptide-like 1 [Eumeta japonica]
MATINHKFVSVAQYAENKEHARQILMPYGVVRSDRFGICAAEYLYFKSMGLKPLHPPRRLSAIGEVNGRNRQRETTSATDGLTCSRRQVARRMICLKLKIQQSIGQCSVLNPLPLGWKATRFTTEPASFAASVHGLPAGGNAENSWPNFGKRNVAALARDGYLKPQSNGYKRSISTLAKNGQLPTFRSPYDDTDKHEEEDDGHDKRNLASIARMRSYAVMKRNIQALARDGYRGGRQSSQQNNKRNIASLARSGFIHKRGDSNIDEYYYPFYQNSVPPLSEMDGPLDDNEVYDFQQSINPDFFPPLAQVYKRSQSMYFDQNDENEGAYENQNYLNDVSFKRGAVGLPVQGLFRSAYVDPSYRTKRYILSLPEPIDQNNLPLPDVEDTNVEDKRSVDENVNMRESFEKRHIGSLARLGLLPSFRYTGSRYSRSGRARLLLPSQDIYRFTMLE